MEKLKNSRKLSKIILELLLLVLVGGYLTTTIVQSTFASNIGKSPNVIITINRDGTISQEGSLFGNDFLYPATEEQAEEGIGGINGVIRINNQYRRIKVSNLAIGLDKDKLQIGNSYPIDMVYNSFLDDIKLKVEKGSLFSFNKTLIDYISLRELLYEPGNSSYRGYMLDDEDSFTLNKGTTVDLKYTLHMVEEAEDELEDVTAIMPIYINVHEYPVADYNKDDGNNHKDYHKGKSIESVENTSIKCHWAHDCIITLLNHEIIIGYPHEKYTIEDYFNGTLDPVIYVNEAVLPDRFVTRAETFTIICKIMGWHDQYCE